MTDRNNNDYKDCYTWQNNIKISSNNYGCEINLVNLQKLIATKKLYERRQILAINSLAVL